MELILIAGAPASGKSTFAKYLGERINAVVISKDDIKEKLFDTVGFKSYEEKRALDRCAVETMYLLAGGVLKTGAAVILDNNFEYSSLPGLESLASEFNILPITVRFEGDLSEIYKRHLEREASPYRHRGHIATKCYPETVKEEFVPMGEENFIKRYTERGMTTFSFGRLITADCTDLSKLDYDILCDKICGYMGNGG